MILYRIGNKVMKLFFLLFYKIQIKGIENIPKDGSAIICANHLHNLDPLLLAAFSKRQICYMAKEELFNNKLLSKILHGFGTFPVKRDAADITAIKTSIGLLKKGRILGIFIEGKRSKTGELQKPKAGTALIALKAKAPIIPIGICGSYKLFSQITISVGEPIYLENYHGKKVSNEEMESISENIINIIKQLI